MARVINRRRLLLGVGGLAGVAVAGCGSGSGSSGTGSRVVWQQNAPAGSGLVSLAARRGALYAGSNANGSGALYAFDARNGSQRWRYSADNLFFANAPTEYRPPICTDDTIYATSGGSSAALHAVDAATGKLRWRYAAPISPAAATADGIFAGTSDALLALDPGTGHQRWTVTTLGTCGQPAVANGIVHAADSSGAVVAVDAASGVQRWRYQCTETGTTRLPDLSYSPPLIANGLVCVSVSTPDEGQPMCHALSADTGQPAWTVTAPARKTSVADSYHGPYLAGSTICLINDTTGNVYAVDAATGTRRWLSTADSGGDFGACPAGTALITGNRKDALYSLDGSTGQVRWRFAHGEVGTNPAFDGLVYVGTSANPPGVDTLYALRP
ncbi:MAG TPA: PQQ-binding-like beta-propeller repeat protein [Pseudonocardiaceae bacterium]|nr:PQQ-binding-like beta-propeller repeat protein [Pseudonocardiaceae bacterium]